MSARPWLALPYGAHVDALVLAAEAGLSVEDWHAMPALTDRHRGIVLAATHALLDDSDERHEAALDATVQIAARPFGAGVPLEACDVVCDAAFVLCAAHLVGRRGLTVDAVREVCAPAVSVPELAAVIGAALDDLTARLGTITARGVS